MEPWSTWRHRGASQLQITLVSASTYIASLLFGLQGGTLADSLSKRMAVVSGYIALAMVCIFVPVFFGTGVKELIFIMFTSSAIMQIVSPSLKAAVALVSSPREMASVAATVSIVGSIGSALGASALAPLLISITGINVLLFVAAAILLAGAMWTYKLPVMENSKRLRDAIQEVDWKPAALSLKNAASWIVEHQSVAAVILVGSIVVALFEGFNTLIPVYVRDVLNANPTNAIYIFAPAGIGFLIGTVLTPIMIDHWSARKLAVVAATIMGVSMVLFGFINVVDGILAPISPLRLLGWIFSVEISDRVLAASTIAIPANFGSTATGAAVMAHINMRVPVVNQGATFGLQEVQDNGLTLVLLLALGIASSIVGPRVVFVIAPIIAVGLVVLLIRYSFRTMDSTEMTGGGALKHLIGEDEPE